MHIQPFAVQQPAHGDPVHADDRRALVVAIQRQGRDLATAIVFIAQLDLILGGGEIGDGGDTRTRLKQHKAILARAAADPALAALQAEQERLMRRLGAPPDTRKFTPHVTLARLRDTAPTELAHYLGLHPIVRPISFTARRVALMSSRDSVGGGPYVLEAAYPLGPSYPNRLSQEAWR